MTDPTRTPPTQSPDAADNQRTLDATQHPAITEATRTMANPPSGHATPQVPHLDGYEVLAPLGEGGMGVVWRAVQLGARRQVALKLLSVHAVGSDRARKRFEREVELAARLEHPHIARIYDSGLAHHVYYYAMELVENAAPLDRYAAAQRLSQEQTLRLMQTVCLAVQHAHQRGVIHRDLKPSNIVVDAAGQPRILDFGLAKTYRDDDAVAISVEGDIAGTPAYMSPEQASGRMDLDTRSDVYALGVILYELLAGRKPHALEGGYLKVLKRISEEEPLRPRAARPDLDAELEAILLKALARDPADRYPSAIQLAEDLQRFLDCEPLSARPATTWYFLRKRLHRHRRKVVAGATAAALAIAAGAYYVHAIDVERRRALEAQEIAQRQQAIAEGSLLRANAQRAVALQTLNDLVFSAQRVLQDEPGANKFRGQLLHIALEGLNRVADSAADERLTPERTTGAAILQVGDLMQALGRHDDAAAAYARAIGIFEELASDHSTARPQHDLMVALTRQGYLQMQLGENAGPALKRAAALADALHGRDDAAALAHDGAVAHLALAEHLAAQGDPDALAHFQQAARTCQAKSPHHGTILRKWAAALLQSDASKAHDALSLLQDAVAIHRTTAGTGGQMELAASLSQLAYAHAALGERSTAEQAIADAVDLSQRAAQAAPDRRDVQMAHAAVCVAAGDAAGRAGNPAAAHTHYAAAVNQLSAAAKEAALTKRQNTLLEAARQKLGTQGGVP